MVSFQKIHCVMHDGERLDMLQELHHQSILSEGAMQSLNSQDVGQHVAGEHSTSFHRGAAVQQHVDELPCRGAGARGGAVDLPSCAWHSPLQWGAAERPGGRQPQIRLPRASVAKWVAAPRWHWCQDQHAYPCHAHCRCHDSHGPAPHKRSSAMAAARSNEHFLQCGCAKHPRRHCRQFLQQAAPQPLAQAPQVRGRGHQNVANISCHAPRSVHPCSHRRPKQVHLALAIPRKWWSEDHDPLLPRPQTD
mmetsp:Transcript_106754/g.205388  ORF Transcript_106754/g.205388 Transcript_106754/m.205388 type:complete len:249 (-) Transcript_106754:790-1536(-)